MSIEFYNNNANDFFENTVDADMTQAYNLFETYLIENNGEILDLGCGSGRDSKYFIEKGFKVTAIDYSEELVKLAAEYIGQKVIFMDMREIDYSNNFVGIWSCASLLHLSEEDIKLTLKKCHTALINNGVIYSSYKYGESNYEKDGRIFTCFTEDKFKNFVKDLDFKILEIFVTGDVRPGREDEKWLNVIMKK